jgi:hypothetical protein
MLRVLLADGGQADHDANEVEFTASGWVVLKWVRLEQQTNPQNFAQTRTVVAEQRIVRGYGPGVVLGILDPDAPTEPVPELEEANAR